MIYQLTIYILLGCISTEARKNMLIIIKSCVSLMNKIKKTQKRSLTSPGPGVGMDEGYN